MHLSYNTNHEMWRIRHDAKGNEEMNNFFSGFYKSMYEAMLSSYEEKC